MIGRIVRLVAWLLPWLVGATPLLAFGQINTTNTTFTTSSSSQSGTVNAVYFWTQLTIGPASVDVGALTGCTLIGSPPFANCNAGGGSGTLVDPFLFSCSGPVALAGCSGQSFTVFAGSQNYNSHTQTVVAVATPATLPVPLGPWVPLASACGVLLFMLLWRRPRRLPD